MIIPSLMSLVIATVAAWLSLNTKEEVVQAAMGLTALFSCLLALFFAPWIFKVLVVGVPLLLERMKYLSFRKLS
jgi:hypothetical protein